MTTTNNKILAKIKALLALANDVGAAPNEAATALRQAQKLMEQHGIELAQVEAPTIQEAHAKARTQLNPTNWEVGLFQMVAKVFGAKEIFCPRFTGRSTWMFIAPEPRAEVAAYVADVLLAKLVKARQLHVAIKLGRVKKRANKIKRADDFCAGWLAIVERQVITFVLSDQEQAAMAKHLAQQETVQFKGRVNGDNGKIDHRDFADGWDAGKDVRLNRGVGKDGGAKALEQL